MQAVIKSLSKGDFLRSAGLIATGLLFAPGEIFAQESAVVALNEVVILLGVIVNKIEVG